MAGLSEAEIAQLYNGIYGPATPQGPAALPTLTLEQMYRGIYGPSSAAPTPQPPAPPTPPAPPQPDAYAGIYGPANRSSQPGAFPNFGSLLDLFPGSSQTRTAQAKPAAVNGTGFGAGMAKADNERLLPSEGLMAMFGVGQPPATRSVKSVPMGQTQVASAAGVPLPRARPNTATATLASMFAPSAASSRQPLRITVDGANPIQSYAPTPVRRSVAAATPAPLSQRPAAAASPAPAASPSTSLWFTDPMAFGRQSVSQSGDTSVGNQLEAAAARSSGEGGRIRRY